MTAAGKTLQRCRQHFDSDTLSSIWVMACRDESPVLTAFSVAYRLRGISPKEVIDLVKSCQELFSLGLTRGQSRGWKARYQQAAEPAEPTQGRSTVGRRRGSSVRIARLTRDSASDRPTARRKGPPAPCPLPPQAAFFLRPPTRRRGSGAAGAGSGAGGGVAAAGFRPNPICLAISERRAA